MNTMKVEEHNSKSVRRNVPMAKCHKEEEEETLLIYTAQGYGPPFVKKFRDSKWFRISQWFRISE